MTEAARRVSWWSVALALLVACAGTEPVPEESAPALETVVAHPRLEGLADQIESSLDDWQMPGLAVAVSVGNELVFAEGFGVKQVGRDERNDSATLFQIGSVTKGFGATAIGLLVDDGLVTFDDPALQHLPWLELSDPELTRRMTLRDLLSHRSGIAEDAYPAMGLLDARAVAERARYLDNTADYGAFRYSNLGYGLLGLVVEEATGLSWSQFVQERLFDPLEMTSSAATPFGVWDADYVAPAFLGTAPAGPVSLDDAPDLNVALPHGIDREGERRVLPWQSYDNMQAAGSVVSNVRDMSRWLRLHLGVLGADDVLTEETRRELHRAQVDAPSSSIFYDAVEGGAPYAMGWHTQTFAGREVLSHGGGIFGFPAYAAFLPELEAGVVVLANGSTWTPYYPHQEIVAQVFARLLDLPARDWHAETLEATAALQTRVDEALAGFDAQRDETTPPSGSAESYAGRYSSEHAGALEVRVADDELLLAFEGHGSFSGTLMPWNGETFRLYFDGGDGQAYSSALVTFVPDEQGLVLDLGRFGRYLR
ncbi:MAG: serine hydrolase [Acidobacteriota bacterium]